MGQSLPPGAGEHGKLERRLAALERFLGPFKYTHIRAETDQGDPRHFRVLAAPGRPEEVQVSTSPIPLTVVSVRPPYIKKPASSVTGTAKRYFIEWGLLNNLVAENWDAPFDISSTTHFFAVATLRTTDTLKVTKWTIKTGSSYNSEKTPDWAVGAARPASCVVNLGAVYVDSGKHSIVQSGGGSILIGEHVTSIQPGSSAGDVKIGKELSYQRLVY